MANFSILPQGAPSTPVKVRAPDADGNVRTVTIPACKGWTRDAIKAASQAGITVNDKAPKGAVKGAGKGRPKYEMHGQPAEDTAIEVLDVYENGY